MPKVDDNREEIELDLSDEELFRLMKMAHEHDITLNQMVERILRELIESLKNDKK